MIILENTMNLLKLKIYHKMSPISKCGIILRLVEENDAEFILSLRTNVQLNRYISTTSDDIADQKKWIKNYKIIEFAGLEFYFIAEDLNGNRYGTIRLYNFDENSFEIGSWLFLPKSPLGMAVKAQFIAIETGFKELKKEYCRLEIRKENEAVLRYMKGFKTTLVREDDLNYYYTLTEENFYFRKKKISFLLKSNP